MAQNYLEMIKGLVEQKISNMTPEERMDMLNAEMKKANPDNSLIETLIQKGVGKTMSMEKVLQKVETSKLKRKVNTNLKQAKDGFSALLKELQTTYTDSFIVDKSTEVIGKIKKTLIDSPEIKFNVDANLPIGINLIHIAVEFGDIELAELLIKREANLESKGKEGICNTPLQWIVIDNSSDSNKVKELIEKHLKDKDSKKGVTP
jgi:Cdc6-like AAA superfamily ATPase